MSGKKEKMKKALGIPEYPWSTDEDDSDAESSVRPALNVPPALIHRCRTGHGSSSSQQGSSSIINEGAGPSSLPGHSGRRAQPAMSERDLYWSLLLTQKQTDLTMRSSSLLAPSRAGRAGPAPRRASPLRELRGMLAFKRTERCSAQRAYANLLAVRTRTAPAPAKTRADDRPSLSHEVASSRGSPAPAPGSSAATPPPPPPPPPPPGPAAPPTPPGEDILMHIDALDSSSSDPRGSFLNDSSLSEANERASSAERVPPEERVRPADRRAVLSLDEVVLEPREPEVAPAPAQDPGSARGGSRSSSESRGTKRKKDDKEETGTELNQNLLRLLECPVCLEWMEPPITQCRRGHLVCAACRARMAACPVCRTAFSSVRNRAMEGVAEMLRYPCRHGCSRAVRLRRRAAHEASCPRRRYACPAPACRAAPPLPLDALKLHVQKKHPAQVLSGRRHSLQLRGGDARELWLLLALEQLFLLRLDSDAAGVNLHVVYVGPKKHAKRYSYECSVVGKHDAARRLVYSRPVHTDCDGAQLKHQDCFHLTPTQALNYLRARRPLAAAGDALDVAVTVMVTGERDEPDDSADT